MLTLHTLHSHSLEIKGSKFLSFIFPYQLFNEQMVTLRHAHPKAVHFVSASRYFNEYEQIVESSSDDGEPKGTSGKPTLCVLQGHQLINIGLITVRYFGGTKLGTGGLVRAYTDSANEVIAHTPFITYEKYDFCSFTCDYKYISLVEYTLTQYSLIIESKTFDNQGALFTIKGKKENIQGLFQTLERHITPQ